MIPAACSFLNKEEKLEINPCDPAANLYTEKNKHYFDTEYLKQDGTVDYNKWFKAYEVQSSNCDPARILKEKKAEEIKLPVQEEPEKKVSRNLE